MEWSRRSCRHIVRTWDGHDDEVGWKGLYLLHVKIKEMGLYTAIVKRGKVS